ncbi:MAG: ABC transporter substrate-binding protein, partial [Actinobacteria bacterium]|nr:ABC transporter substrate-binding protein [Actinomycetota bacterium]
MQSSNERRSAFAPSRRSLLKGALGLAGSFGAVGLLAACGGPASSVATTASSAGSAAIAATPTPIPLPKAATGATTTSSTRTAAASTSTGASTTTEVSSSSATAAASETGKTLVVAFNADPETLDPHHTTALLAVRAMAPFYDTLIKQDYDASWKPALASAWEVSSDGLTYTFHLQKGVIFHSGKELTADDVKYTYDRWRSPATKSPTAYQIAPLDTVTAPDPYTVVFKLKTPYNIFLDQVGSGYAVILNKDVVEKAGKDYGVTVVDGSGPFQFVSWARGQKLVGKRYAKYTWGSPIFQNRGPAHVAGLEFRIVPDDNTRVTQFKAGDLNIVNDVPPAEVANLDKNPNVKVIRYQQFNTSYLGFNIQNAPVSDVNVRKAINMSINKDDIVKGAYFGLGTPARGMLVSSTPGYLKDIASYAYKYDPAGAKKLLDDSGWKVGSDGVRTKGGQKLEIPFWIINDSTDVLQAQILQQQLGDLGIK